MKPSDEAGAMAKSFSDSNKITEIVHNNETLDQNRSLTLKFDTFGGMNGRT